MKDNTFRIFLIQPEHLFQVPCDSLSLAVFIARKPHCISFLHLGFERLHKVVLLRVNHIVGRVAVLKINPHAVLPQRLYIADMPLRGKHVIVLSQEFLNRLCFRRRLHYY